MVRGVEKIRELIRKLIRTDADIRQAVIDLQHPSNAGCKSFEGAS